MCGWIQQHIKDDDNLLVVENVPLIAWHGIGKSPANLLLNDTTRNWKDWARVQNMKP